MKLTKEQAQEIKDQQSQSNSTKRVTAPELEKILYEAENLSLMCYAHDYYTGTIVLCGTGWSPVKYNWFLNEYEPPSNVRIISYDEFVQEYIVN